ncbi:adenine phosphoribosyltransferase [Verrucomicrobia bacterium SCGC AG-212-E04]|nr:adenine phosphoribosyltransferase [Verrucomicrobia bacterium SCGC AG-212-E04]
MSASVLPSPPTAPLYAAIRDVPDFPKPGIVFKDIMPILADPVTLRLSIDLFEEACLALPARVDKIVGIDARGFLFGAALAYKMGLGFIAVRKAGKLPGKTEAAAYTLEYGESTVEMLSDALQPGERVALIDDLLATGGTAAAAIKLIEKLGATAVGALFLVELEFLGGRARLGAVPVRALLKY